MGDHLDVAIVNDTLKPDFPQVPQSQRIAGVSEAGANGTYVNGIRVLKCILRNNDQIDIGEAKIVFIEEKTRGKS